MNSFRLKHLRRIRTPLKISGLLGKEKPSGRFIATLYDSITSSPNIAAGIKRTQSANDNQIKWLKKLLTTTSNKLYTICEIAKIVNRLAAIETAGSFSEVRNPIPAIELREKPLSLFCT